MRLISEFTFLDLAGSEKTYGEYDPILVKEANFINKSLTSLGIVIQALKAKQEQNPTSTSKK